MGKACGRKRRLKKKFNYKVDRKKLWKKTKKLPNIDCPQISAMWSTGHSIQKNLYSMGLSSNVNKSIPIPSTKEVILKELNFKPKNELPKAEPQKLTVCQDLESEAKAPRPDRFRLPKGLVSFCTYMLEKHGEDFKAMARDPRNHYQMTPKQIRSNINKFKNVPAQYQKYLDSKMDVE